MALAQEARSVRVFVSSTFRDMAAERDELAKFVFPELRKLCEQRGVTWGEVDLRWGITDEQKAEGKVLPICLEEIRRCRPYFIGLLGERYGWVPDEIPRGLIDQEPWLDEHPGRSVTELEVLHGVLRNPDMATHAFFYLRDPAYVDLLSPEQRGSFREDSPELQARLAALKDRIRASGFPVREGYADPKSLGQLVLRDLTEVIDRLYPTGPEADPLEREAAEHEAFARSRAGVYIGREAYFERLDAHAQEGGPPLTVTGGSGSGKSALLASWAMRYRAQHPQDLFVMHFIGGSPYSSDWAGMLRRIIGEISRRSGVKVGIPYGSDELRQAFASALHTAATEGRVVLVLDALNQLEDRDGARDLLWLPHEIPAGVRIILSTLSGRPLDELAKRGWPTLEVAPLEPDERRRLIAEYLRQYTKELSADRAARIASAPQCANPLYLRALLDELRLWGEHETLDRAIEHYLGAAGIPELYELILGRYEQDYDRERRGLVKDAFSLVFAARRGLSESELLDLLGDGGEPLPRAYWSPLYLAAEPSLVARSGLIGFFHDYLRQAVERRYLPSPGDRRAAHLLLADYFEPRWETPRGIDEVPWQLAEAASWQRLFELLADEAFLQRASEFDVKSSWARIEAGSPLRLVDAYRPILDGPGGTLGTLEAVSSLLLDTGHPSEALVLQKRIVDHYRRPRWMPGGDDEMLAHSLGNMGATIMSRGDLDEAMGLFREQEKICRRLTEKSVDDIELITVRYSLEQSLTNQAMILTTRGELDQAMRLLEEAERICRKLGNKAALARSFGHQAVILSTRGELDQAMELHKEAERICRELGDKAGLQMCLGNQAVILYARGELDQAMELLEDQERICRELGDKGLLAHSLGNQAVILYARGELDESMALHKEEERICRAVGDKEQLGASLGNQAVILCDRGDLDESMALQKEAARIHRERGDKAGLRTSLLNQAEILTRRGELDEAMALHREQEQICRDLGDKAGLQVCLGKAAALLITRGDLDEAMTLLKEQEQICRELGDKAGVQASRGNQAAALIRRGELDEAMVLLKEQEQICRELSDKAGLQASLGNHAAVRITRGDLDEAMALLKEQERICRELGNKADLQASLGNQGLVLRDRGKPDEAMVLLREQERICRELGLQEGLSTSLYNQAAGHALAGRLDAALPLMEEATSIAQLLGRPNLQDWQKALQFLRSVAR